jgi:hypothetical protein
VDHTLDPLPYQADTDENLPESPVSLHSPILPVKRPIDAYEPLLYPIPARSHSNYPFYTPGGGDTRYFPTQSSVVDDEDGDAAEDGMKWVGPMMIITQLLTSTTHEPSSPVVATATPPTRFRDLDLVSGPGRNHYASFTWDDLFEAVAPWLEERVPDERRIDGEGLGN